MIPTPDPRRSETAPDPGGVSVPRRQLLEDGSLLLEWPDGHQTVLGEGLLRRSCPCASCRDRHPDLDPPPARIVRHDPVGRYAVQLTWSDGHSSGIYPYRQLREACPCFHCRTMAATGATETPAEPEEGSS
ncbi:MAG: DUF971 domain-containing protein [Candidatus Eisenbacteria bacterium]